VAALAALVVLALATGSCAAASGEARLLASFYSATDAGREEEALSLLADDAVYDSWALAINGNHLGTVHVAGRDKLRPYLHARGMSRNFYGTEGPFYLLRSLRVSGERVAFELLPDRRAETGRPYNVYRGEFVVAGGKIRAMTMVEVIGWL
jgi:hypothetical protein